MREQSLATLADTDAFARRIATALRAGDTLLLDGDLGTGKTTFAQALIGALSPQPVEVTSPTFTLLQTYPVTLANGAACELYHYDLYRIDNPAALVELGLDEAEPFLRVIEWPQHAGAALNPRSWVHLQLTLSGQTRTVSMRAHGAVAERLERIAA